MILGKGKRPNAEVLKSLSTYRFDVLVCEMVACYGMAVGKEVFETARWVGRYEQKAADLQREFGIVYRKDVKIHLCNSMKAKDGNIRQALIDKFGPQGTKKKQGATYGISNDVWQALGVAVTYSERMPITPTKPESV